MFVQQVINNYGGLLNKLSFYVRVNFVPGYKMWFFRG